MLGLGGGERLQQVQVPAQAVTLLPGTVVREFMSPRLERPRSASWRQRNPRCNVRPRLAGGFRRAPTVDSAAPPIDLEPP